MSESEGKIARLRRELAEAEKEAGVPVSGEPVGEVYTMEALVPGGGVRFHVSLNRGLPAGTKLFTHPPHALAAAQAEVKRLRGCIRALLSLISREAPQLSGKVMGDAEAALSTPADTSELDRLVADAGRAKWQPIETAPKDGSDILVFNPVSREQFVAYFEHGQWCFSAHHAMRDCPTHWMPLPDAPDAARAEVKS